MKKSALFTLFVLSILLSASGNLFASTITSAGTGTSGTPSVWGTGGSWVGGIAPVSGDDVIIVAGDYVTTGAITRNGSTTISGTLYATGSIGGSGAFSLNNGSTIQATGGGTVTISNDISLVSGTINIPTPFGGGGDLILTGTVSGSGLINQTSDISGRRITINHANTYSGGHTMSGTGSGYPTITFNNAASLGTGTLTSTITGVDFGRGYLEPSTDLSGGSGVANNILVSGASDRMLVYANGTRHLKLSGIISGSGYLVKIGTATLTLTGTNTYTGKVVINAGTLSVATIGNGGVAGNLSQATNAAANLVLGGGTLDYSGSTASTDRNFTLTASTTSGISVSNGATTLTISGSTTSTNGALTKSGSGTLVLSGTNLHTGVTTVSAGTLSVATIGNGGVSGNLSQATNAAANIVLGGGTLDYSGSTASTDRNFTLTAATTSGLSVSNGATTLTISGAAASTSGALTKSGSGTLELTGANLYTGLTTVSAGTLRLNRSGGTTIPATNNVTVSGGTLKISSDQTVASLTVSSGTLTVDAGITLTITGTFTGGGTINNQGTIVLQGGSAQTFPGATTTINNGTSGQLTNLTINNSSGVTLNNSFTVGGTLTLTSGGLSIGTNTLTLNGAVSGSGTLTGSSTSNLVIAGAAGNLNFTSGSRILKDLTLNSGATATLNTPLDITAGSSSGTVIINSGATLTTGGNLTIKSDANGTARVGNSAGSISGNVAVERYVPSKSGRKWTFVASPVTVSTIRAGWQDDVFITGVGTGGTPCGTGTGDGGGTDRYNSNGFDATSFSTPSLYTYNATPVSGSRWVSVANTNVLGLTPGKGYRINIRGPRGASDANCYSQLGTVTAPTVATLSAAGTLSQGDVPTAVYGTTSYGASNAYTLIGNPYASEVSLQAFLADNSNITSSFWFYTPVNGASLYCTYNASTQQAANFPSGYSNGSGVANVILASGQSFFVERNQAADATVTFKEAHKSVTATGGANFYRTQYTITDKIQVQFNSVTDPEARTQVFINYLNAPGTSLTNATEFDTYSFNTGNNHYLVSDKAGKSMAIQTRPAFTGNDTVSLKIKGDAGNFKLEFSDYADFTAASTIKLLDSYTNTETDIRLNPEYNFSIDANAASQGANRFKIVFKTAVALPVSYIALSAQYENSFVQLRWNVGGEYNMNTYTAERSADGRNFTGIGTLPATGNNNNTVNYSLIDNKPLAGISYYRVKAISSNNAIKYSPVVKLKVDKTISLHIYPNPVQDKLNVVLNVQDASAYTISITNMHGTEVMRKLNVMPRNGVIEINTSTLPAGIYTLRLLNNKEESVTAGFIKQ